MKGFGQAQQGWEDCGCEEDKVGQQVLGGKLNTISKVRGVYYSQIYTPDFRYGYIYLPYIVSTDIETEEHTDFHGDSLNGRVILNFRAEAKDGINRTALREIKLLQEVHIKMLKGSHNLNKIEGET